MFQFIKHTHFDSNTQTNKQTNKQINKKGNTDRRSVLKSTPSKYWHDFRNRPKHDFYLSIWLELSSFFLLLLLLLLLLPSFISSNSLIGVMTLWGLRHIINIFKCEENNAKFILTSDNIDLYFEIKILDKKTSQISFVFVTKYLKDLFIAEKWL